jgi:hypothetical protein
MTDFKYVYLVRHPVRGGVVARAPLDGCNCVICLYVRERQLYYCKNCNNGGGLDGCWFCGRSLWFTEPLFTDDPAVGA